MSTWTLRVGACPGFNLGGFGEFKSGFWRSDLEILDSSRMYLIKGPIPFEGSLLSLWYNIPPRPYSNYKAPILQSPLLYFHLLVHTFFGPK